MKNIFDVLRQKKAELEQVQKDVEVLQIAARLLADDGDMEVDSMGSLSAAELTRPSSTAPAVPSSQRSVAPVGNGNGRGYGGSPDNAMQQT